MNESPAFSIGDTAVYPSHGVADVIGLETKKLGEQELGFYHLQVRSSGLKIIVPIHKAETNGMRPVATDADITEVYSVLKRRDIETDRSTWNRRYRGFIDKIRTGSLSEIAAVFRDLALLRSEKTLSHGEREMMRNARELLVRELSVAQDTPPEKVEAELDSLFKN